MAYIWDLQVGYCTKLYRDRYMQTVNSIVVTNVLISSNADEGLARLKRFFPTVDNDTILSVMRAKKNEEKSVKQLLALGFPLKKQP